MEFSLYYKDTTTTKKGGQSIFLWVIVCTVFWGFGVSLIARLHHGEIARVLKFEDLVAPAGPSGLEVSGEQLQAFGFGADVGSQHVCVDGRGKHKREAFHPSIHPSIQRRQI